MHGGKKWHAPEQKVGERPDKPAAATRARKEEKNTKNIQVQHPKAHSRFTVIFNEDPFLLD